MKAFWKTSGMPTNPYHIAGWCGIVSIIILELIYSIQVTTILIISKRGNIYGFKWKLIPEDYICTATESRIPIFISLTNIVKNKVRMWNS